jgi:thiol:disulfide interchange protein
MRTTIIASGGLPEGSGEAVSKSKRSSTVALVAALVGVGLLAVAWLSRSAVVTLVSSGVGILAMAYAMFRVRSLARLLLTEQKTDPHNLYSTNSEPEGKA